MPYNSVKELPKHIKKFSPVVRRNWMHVWNSVFKKTGSEARAFKGANSILKKRFKGKKTAESNSRHDHIQYLVNDFLGNLPG